MTATITELLFTADPIIEEAYFITTDIDLIVLQNAPALPEDAEAPEDGASNDAVEPDWDLARSCTRIS